MQNKYKTPTLLYVCACMSVSVCECVCLLARGLLLPIVLFVFCESESGFHNTFCRACHNELVRRLWSRLKQRRNLPLKSRSWWMGSLPCCEVRCRGNDATTAYGEWGWSNSAVEQEFTPASKWWRRQVEWLEWVGWCYRLDVYLAWFRRDATELHVGLGETRIRLSWTRAQSISYCKLWYAIWVKQFRFNR